MKGSTEQKPLRILLVLTGGTIGTVIGEDGMRRLPEEDGWEPMLIRALRERAPELLLDVKVRVPYQVLSEHMTPDHLEKLAACLREEDLTQYDGVFVTHGSDTLAYTAAYLGELMQGCPIPVFLLATQRPLEDPENNGVENTLAAAELLQETVAGGQTEYSWKEGRVIPDGPKPDTTAISRGEKRDETAIPDGMTEGISPVYIPYRNSDGVMYLHRAEELRQCRPGTDDFFSDGMRALERTTGSYHWPEGWGETKTAEGAVTGITEDTAPPVGCGSVTGPLDWRVPSISLTPDVLMLHPYVGIRYDCISLKGVRAVLHTLYHSSTAPKELAGFLDHCKEAGVPCYILPCDPENYHYDTTAELLTHGAIPLSGMTEERAYMRLLLRKEM